MDKKNLHQTRKCLVTGLTEEKKDLVRFVIGPDQNLVPDIDQNLPGRGYWVLAQRSIIEKALKKNVFLRIVKNKISIDPNLLKIIESQTTKKIINQISLSRKAGMAIFGFEKVKSALLNKNIGLLIQASDGSKREKQRIITANTPSALNDCLSGAELGKAFGREKVIHCVILLSGFVENIVFNANRLNNLKNPVPQHSNIEIDNKN